MPIFKNIFVSPNIADILNFRIFGKAQKCLLSPAGRAGDYKTHSVCVCVGACVRVLLSVCHAFIKGCTSHWLFLLGLFNVFYDLIAYVLSFDAVISQLGP